MGYQDLPSLKAVSSDFRAFCRACEQMEERWGQNHAWRGVDHDLIHFGHKYVDEVSRRIIPANFRQMSLVPVGTTGDGNCLFNLASLLVCQVETLALELRPRTCLELAENWQFYRNHRVSKCQNSLPWKRWPWCYVRGNTVRPDMFLIEFV